MNMNEVWKPVIGFEGRYEVSNHGNVRSVDCIIYRKNGTKIKHRGTLLKPIMSQHGYFYVNLNQRGCKIHRLVYEAFVGEIPKGRFHVHHIDGNKTNNVPNNLLLLPHGEHSTLTHKGKHLEEETKAKIGKANSGKLKNRKDMSKKVQRYSLDGGLIDSFPSTMEAYRQTGILPQNIGACANGKIKTAGGYIWRYLNKVVTK